MHVFLALCLTTNPPLIFQLPNLYWYFSSVIIFHVIFVWVYIIFNSFAVILLIKIFKLPFLIRKCHFKFDSIFIWWLSLIILNLNVNIESYLNQLKSNQIKILKQGTIKDFNLKLNQWMLKILNIWKNKYCSKALLKIIKYMRLLKSFFLHLL